MLCRNIEFGVKMRTVHLNDKPCLILRKGTQNQNLFPTRFSHKNDKRLLDLFLIIMISLRIKKRVNVIWIL